ncbi:Lipase 2 precursor [Nocardia otitidiscaviarum]|uniref:Lipase 2 n=1 Tax=Nocardia otitidiscaviarum TaxID=1823 RepID=A0A378YM26_9NOCA|nr:SGNH/GDSL hydrolase family protein [Nocardia otitidiscaviarum]SUA77557.1 Lipase 2 precursor [Nocardia otitidiscaviarum]
MSSRTITAALAGVAATVLSLATATAAPADGGAEYVALGDSGAATTGIVNFDTSAPLSCARSTTNYPHLVAARLGLRLDDRTCSSARIPHLTQSQAAGVPPQLDALGPNTRLVTLHIGANDARFTAHLLDCYLAAARGGCAGTADGWDADIDAIAAPYAAALREITRRAPHAALVVDGWPRYLRDGGCPETLGLAPADAAYIQSKFERLNAVVAREAAAVGALYVDTVAASAGRDACAPAGVRWFDPLLATETLVPYHPTVQGMRGVADRVVEAVRAAGVLPL